MQLIDARAFDAPLGSASRPTWRGLLHLIALLAAIPLLMGWLIGIAMSEIVLWASGRYRAPITGWIAIGGCVWTYATTYLLFYGVDVGDVARSGNGIWVGLGIAIAGYTAYQRTL